MKNYSFYYNRSCANRDRLNKCVNTLNHSAYELVNNYFHVNGVPILTSGSIKKVYNNTFAPQTKCR